MKIEKDLRAAISFSDVLLIPQMSFAKTRGKNSDDPSEPCIDISSKIGKTNLSIPVISANMSDITGPNMAYEMFRHGGMGILHRFDSVEQSVESFKNVYLKIKQNYPNLDENEIAYYIGVSIGVNSEKDLNRFRKLSQAGARFFCIDIAHGHHVLMSNMLKLLSQEIKNNNEDRSDYYIMAGNVATPEGAFALYSWGADCVKVGIGPGNFCETRKRTGCGYPQLQAILDINEKYPHIPIISDGGIKSSGDICKALAAGASAVMVGSIISGTTETPGQVYTNEKGDFYKMSGGSASGENKIQSGQKNKFVEGVRMPVPFRGHVKYILRQIDEGVRSSFSYSGSFNLPDFQKKSKFRLISGGGKSESKI